jgi:type II restriction/modification system DNA methylase subunit YeeA
MDTSALKKFAQAARRQLIEQVAARMEQVLRTDSVEIREKAQAVEELKKQIAAPSSKEEVVDKVAYTWFNRFCALRFMDVNHYTSIGVVTPIEGHTQPEVLAEAKLGVIDDDFKLDKARVFDLLNGQYPSNNPQQEAYRLLLKGACNALNDQMPFLFPKIDDYTELLMPDDLLSENSVLQGMRETLTPAACEDVEVIGWLYQYYISERKDEVFAALKKKQKIEAQNIPAATQLFTPHWIVRYLVENSLGRLWLLNRPHSKLAAAMDYYIAPEQAETDFLQLGSPEEIKLADPACGSGHMLTYAFDLLYAIYEEEGYDPVEIPRLILEKNLYGIEIDERAGNLAAFALTMKARAKDRRFFTRNGGGGVEPKICVLENVHFSASELDAYKKKVGNDLFTQDLWFLLTQFEQADNFGSLIRPQVKHPEQMLARLEEVGVFSDLLLYSTNEKVKKILKQAEYLSSRYHVVVANPPYMGSKGTNGDLKDFLKDQYSDVKSDTFSAFIVRNLEMSLPRGLLGFMSPFVWMFISSYEKLRHFLVSNKTITSLIQLEYSGFKGATVPICTFTLENAHHPDYRGGYVRLSDFRGADNQAPKALEAIKNPDCGWFYRASATDFKKIPGAPVAYWVSEQMRGIFAQYGPLGKFVDTKAGLMTGDNNHFLRLWWEVSDGRTIFNASSKQEVEDSGRLWCPLNKGGSFRKWYGNQDYLIAFDRSSYRILKETGNHCPSEEWYFKESISWPMVTSSRIAFRYYPKGFIFNIAALVAFPNQECTVEQLLSLCNNKFTAYMTKVLNPTLNFSNGDFNRLPAALQSQNEIANQIRRLVQGAKIDWNSYEVSWDFSTLPLLRPEHRHQEDTLAAVTAALRMAWQTTTVEMQRLEEENNRIFIEAYGLEEELTPEVSIKEITLTCNAHNRYGGNKSEEELKELLLADTMKEFISYAVGCMFGRYSLDKPGLVLANAGEMQEDYLRQVPEPSFMPDDDNVIPILAGEWFEDDIAERFKHFLKVTFGTEHYEENLAFIEDAIGKDIRSYFVKDFYNNHVKMYKKRPIYWLFSSPKGSFNALIYMHRYRPDTVSVILNGYLRQYREKLKAHKSHQEAIERNPGASQSEKTKALKEVDRINKVLAELKEYEDEVLYPLATQQIAIDLDNGVKANYPRFGEALKAVKGLSE